MALTLEVEAGEIVTDARGHTYRDRQVLSATPLDEDWSPGKLSTLWCIEAEEG